MVEDSEKRNNRRQRSGIRKGMQSKVMVINWELEFAKIFFITVMAMIISTFFIINANAGQFVSTGNYWYYTGEDLKTPNWNTQERVDEAIAQVNAIRLAHGKLPLVKDEVLMQAAKVRAKEITRVYEHTRPNGQEPGTATNGRYYLVGENIARGQRNTAEVIVDWMNSEGHRNNILHDRYTGIGIATVEQNGATYWVQLFLME